MMKEKHNIDNVFRGALYDYNIEPPKYIWDDIKTGLEKKRKAKRLMLYRSMAAAVALLISFLSGYYLTGLINSPNDIIADNSVQTSNNSLQNSAIIKEAVNVTSNNLTPNQFNNELITKTNDIVPVKEVEISNKNSNSFILSDIEGEHKVENISNITNLNFKGIEMALLNAEIITKEDDYHQIINNVYLDNLAYPGSEKVINGFKGDLQKNRNGKWAIAGNFSPAYTLNESISPVINSASELLSSVEKKPSTEKTLLAYNGGMKVNYQINKRFSIEGGIYYLKQGKQIDNVRIDVNELAIYDGGNLIETDSYTTTSNFGEIRYNTQSKNELSEKPVSREYKKTVFTDNKLQQNFEYIEIPVYFKYKVIDRKIDIQMRGGLVPGFLITNKVFINPGKEKQWIGYTEGVNKINYQASFGVGFDYPLSKKIVFNLEPTFKYSLNSLSLRNDIKPISLGVFTGLSYFFN